MDAPRQHPCTGHGGTARLSSPSLPVILPRVLARPALSSRRTPATSNSRPRAPAKRSPAAHGCRGVQGATGPRPRPAPAQAPPPPADLDSPGSAVARALGPRSGSRGMSPAAAYLPARVERSGRGGRAEPAAAPQSRTAGSTALPRRRRVACLTESARRVRT